MTNEERSPNLEIRNGETGRVDVPFELRVSAFFRHSSFGFRHYPEPPQVGADAVYWRGSWSQCASRYWRWSSVIQQLQFCWRPPSFQRRKCGPGQSANRLTCGETAK